MALKIKTFKPETVNEKLVDRFIRHAILIERFKAGEAKSISQHLNREVFPVLYDKLMNQLSRIQLGKVKSRYAMRRLRDMIVSTNKMSEIAMVKAGEMSISRLQDLSTWEANWTQRMLEKTIPLDITMNMPSAELLRQTVITKSMESHKMRTWFKSFNKTIQRNILKKVGVGITAGESIPQIGKRLRDTLRVSAKKSQHIARTAVSNVVNNAREEIYKRNKDLIKSVQYLATLDTRTTLICINLDGQVFPVGEGPRPPQHFNCRSTSVPVISAWNELSIEPPPPGTRASMNGAVPDRVLYKDWLKGRGVRIQDEVLGKTRGRLYRQGMDLGGFVGKDLKPISLSKLKFRINKNN